MVKQYASYTSDEGNLHFADADVGDEVYYSVALDNVIINTDATIDSVVWDLPTELVSTDFYLLDKDHYNKIQTDIPGIYEISITVISSYSGKEIIEVSNVYLRVLG